MTKEQLQQSATTAVAKTNSTSSNAIEKVKKQGNFIGLKAKDVQSVLGAYQGQIASVLPKHLTAERIIAMAATEITRNPMIAKCSSSSLIGAVLQASILGFQPVAALGYCYFVPYGNDVQFQIGYKGMLSLARRSGEIKDCYAEVVREGDEFSYTLGLHRDLVHKPTGDISKPITHAYAVVEYKDGGMTFCVLSRAEIERLRMRSPMQKRGVAGAWATDYEAMAKAKAIKQLSKYLPLTVDQVENIATDGMVIKPENIEDGRVKTEDIATDELIILKDVYAYEESDDDVDYSVIDDSNQTEIIK